MALLAGLLSGYALVGTGGHLECAEGELQDSELSPAAASQLSSIFHRPDNLPSKLEVCGQVAVVVQSTACDVYATFHRRRASVCVSNLPSGVLICLGPYPLPILAPLVFKACSALRD